jgi:Arc/MetJ family transcription regulator
MYYIHISPRWQKEECMRKTTVLIDEELLEAAAESIGARTKKETIEAALLSLVRQYNREKLRKELGTFDIDLTSEELERLRNAE